MFVELFNDTEVEPSSERIDDDFSNSCSELAFEWAETNIPERTELVPPTIPPQLHPAVLLGLRRVSSGYITASNSMADLRPMVNDNDAESCVENQFPKADLLDSSAREELHCSLEQKWNSSDLLYHDIMMNVFTFLDAPSLAAFSETARRPNFECFYFLQLQLQRALLQDSYRIPSSSCPFDDDRLSSIRGSASISRLASLDLQEAQDAVQEYIDSNSTLKTMPLSHSLAYIRQFLRLNGLDSDASGTPSAQTLTSVVMMITIMGAASLTSDMSFGTELPNMIFKVGVVGGSFFAASQRKPMMEQAEHMARSVQEISFQSRRMFEAFMAAASGQTRFSSEGLSSYTARNSEEDGLHAERTSHEPLTPNPYEHLTAMNDVSREEEKEDPVMDVSRHSQQEDSWKIPSGCVGAYFQAVRRATSLTTQIIKERRLSNFQALPDKDEVATRFIDACCSDDTLWIVKDLIQRRDCIDVDGFYVGSDGTETCALHASAFHAATGVLEFLCQGIDESDPSKDGGLCACDLRDANGWTAVHFAAGANSVEAVRILAEHGADLAVEAKNGYTPLQWAKRLHNEEVAEELRCRLGAEKTTRWSSRPFSMIAHRFFSIIPTH